jgi:hypothetical protein
MHIILQRYWTMTIPCLPLPSMLNRDTVGSLTFILTQLILTVIVIKVCPLVPHVYSYLSTKTAKGVH